MVKKGATSENAALQDLFRRHVLCDSKLTPFSSHVKRFPSCLRRACMVGYKHGARTPFQPYGRDYSHRRRLPLPERTHYRRIHSATYPGTPRIQRSFHSPGISQPNPHPIRQGPQRCGPHGDYDARGTVGDGGRRALRRGGSPTFQRRSPSTPKMYWPPGEMISWRPMKSWVARQAVWHF